MKKIVILGSTGSIGTSALKVIAQFPEKFRIVGLTAGNNIDLLMRQINAFSPSVVALSDDIACGRLKALLKQQHCPELLRGVEGICEVARLADADIVVSAIVGSAGLLPTLAAIRAGKTVALANKETLVMAGPLIIREVRSHKAVLIPVDSEHSALLQCMKGYDRSAIKKLILTASGGPFLGRTMESLRDVPPADALRHPNWNMGKKITIDSATLMNKGLEVIEAHHLFGMPPEQIDVLIHPQSIVHSIVEFVDGSYIAQFSRPDMRAPIAFALSCPERLNSIVEPLDWESLSGLTFLKPDRESFPCLSLAYHALDAGGTLPTVLNAANEIAVKAFLDGVIVFTAIPVIIAKVMELHSPMPADDLSVILDADRWAKDQAHKEIWKQ
jgi:1-deoxy-D-xylulose-5-phosphate reductoisomerase